MPYIKEVDRRRLDMRGWRGATSPGELNYLLSQLCKEYLRSKDESYTTYNDIIGALECCKMELYRRKVALYEDEKIKENGDVW